MALKTGLCISAEHERAVQGCWHLWSHVKKSTSLVLSLAALTVAAAAAAAAESAAALAAVEAALAQLASLCRPSLKRCLRSSACHTTTSQSSLNI